MQRYIIILICLIGSSAIFYLLSKILKRENRIELYKESLKFLKTRVNLDLALFKDDIWSH